MDLDRFRSGRREMETCLSRLLGAVLGLTLQELARKDPGPP